MKIIGIEMSPRASSSVGLVMEMVGASGGSLSDLNDLIYSFAGEGAMSNSEGMLISALGGAFREGAEIGIEYGADLYRAITDGNKRYIDEFLARIGSCHGIVISTPVYFGDRSCYTEAFLGLIKRVTLGSFPFSEKTVGILSVGAKRNGGQETTNIFALYDALSMGAVIVGNGPPTSQYGGTGWAGDKGRILDDDFGLKTAYGTGRRVAQVSKIIKTAERLAGKEKLKIGVLKFQYASRMAERIAEEIVNNGHAVSLIDVFGHDIKPCLACSICPHPKAPEGYLRCIVRDSMAEMLAGIEDADGLVFTSSMEHSFDGMDKYQIFLERTRCIRRNHFQWSNLPVAIAVNELPDTGSIFGLRAISSTLRHNTFVFGPVYRCLRTAGDQCENLELSTFLEKYLSIAQKWAYYRCNVDSRNEEAKYEAVGYSGR